MQNYTYYFLLLLMLALFAACEQTINLELPEYENDIVLYGVLVGGEKPQIVLTESTGYFDPLNNRDRVKVIEDAQVTLKDETQTYDLTFDADITYYLQWGENENGEWDTDSINYGGYTNDLIIEEGRTYSIEINHQGRTITGETTVPEKIALKKATTEIEFFNDPFSPNLTCYKNKVLVYFDDKEEENFYQINRALERWSYRFCDRFENDTIMLDSCQQGKFSFGFPVFSDVAFNGTTNYAHEIGLSDYGCNSSEPDTLAEPHGYTIYKFTMQSVSKELYDFNISLNMQLDSEGNPFQEPSTIKSTVEGGVGVFASKSASSDTVMIRVDERF